jgi:hypothetical protein
MVMPKNSLRPVFPIIFFFIMLNALFATGRNVLDSHGFDRSVLIVGNLVVFLATVASFLFASRGLKSTNPQAFVRSVYLSIMVKLFVCIIAALIYIFMFRDNLNKPALFTCMGLYLVYTFFEVSALTRLLKGKKNV